MRNGAFSERAEGSRDAFTSEDSRTLAPRVFRRGFGISRIQIGPQNATRDTGQHLYGQNPLCRNAAAAPLVNRLRRDTQRLSQGPKAT